jgi:hypothetical protein
LVMRSGLFVEGRSPKASSRVTVLRENLYSSYYPPASHDYTIRREGSRDKGYFELEIMDKILEEDFIATC